MDAPAFDAMLKTALDEALRQDVEEAPAVPPPSRRQRKRMRKLLTSPSGRGAPFFEAAAQRRLRLPARWLAAAVIAALLTGAAAAGLALGNGEWFRQWFDQGDWAGYYGGAADTEQLLGMGVEMEASAVEASGMRLEVLDAVFDGQRLLMFARMTMLDRTLLEWFQENGELNSFEGFESMEFLLKGETESPVNSWGIHFSQDMLWMEEPEAGEYPILLELDLEGLEEGCQAELRLTDLRLWGADGSDNSRPGEWTLVMTLKPVRALYMASPRTCRADGADWVLDSLTLSPLTLRMKLHCLVGQQPEEWYPFKDLAIHMKNGETIGLEGCSASTGISGHRVGAQFDFAMPLDLEQVDYLHICGEDIYLDG